MQAIFETVFDIVYLSTVIFLGIRMLKRSGSDRQYRLYGAMAVTLGCGDAFHLVPRAIALCTTGLDSYTALLGIGKLITSVTMTAFYVLLYYVWRTRYQISGQNKLTAGIWGLAAARVLLCAMPQNRWTSADAPLIWGIYRNIPFLLLGMLIIILTASAAKQANDKSFRFLWLTIVLSFGFYLPVVLFADAYPVVGVLMIPKTCAYVWTVRIGYNAMKSEIKL